MSSLKLRHQGIYQDYSTLVSTKVKFTSKNVANCSAKTCVWNKKFTNSAETFIRFLLTSSNLEFFMKLVYLSSYPTLDPELDPTRLVKNTYLNYSHPKLCLLTVFETLFPWKLYVFSCLMNRSLKIVLLERFL